jgi:gentisate 1,2-dioxygenase
VKLGSNGSRAGTTRIARIRAAVFSVVEGSRVAMIGNQHFDFEPKDTFVMPSWESLSLCASTDAVFFSFSDRPLQEALGIHRELRQ